MEHILKILSSLSDIRTKSSKTEDNWGYIKINGGFYLDFIKNITELKQLLINSGYLNSLRVQINSADADTDDIEAYAENPRDIIDWQIHLNKEPIIRSVASDGSHYNFFTTVDSCKEWIQKLQPLLKDCPLNSFTSLTIIVEGLNQSFGGPVAQFIGANHVKLQYSNDYRLPSWEQLRENIHFITSEDININPNAWVICENPSSTLAMIFISKAALVMSVCLVNEYYSEEKVIIDGIKRIPLKITGSRETINISFYKQLCHLIEWVFEDRVSVRKKLFNERLTLDMDQNESLLEALSQHLTNAFSQAKERYNFVIIDRKDAYVKELKELLKDIRTQSELYSTKIRTLLSNFLRDLLAAIVLIGFTIFTKFTDSTSLANNNLLIYVFNGLAIYYILSIIMQSVVDFADVYVSQKEILYWKNATKELLPEKEFMKHIDSSLKGRRISLRIIYPLIAICYLAIAFACYKYPEILMTIIKK